MKNFVVLIPSYNDWDCLNLLIPSIDKKINNNDINLSALIINDGSTIKNNLRISNIKNIKSIEILNLKKNVKAQIAIASGLEFLKDKNYEGGIIVMDADGQDDPETLIPIIEKVKIDPYNLITINRITRKDNKIFITFYNLYLILTWLFLFRSMRFGVFSYIHSNSLISLLKDNHINYAYVGSIAKKIKKKNIILANRNERYLGESKNNYISLVVYAFKILTFFRSTILLNSLFFSFLTAIISDILVINFIIFISILIFNFLIFLIYYKNKNLLSFDRKNNISSLERVRVSG